MDREKLKARLKKEFLDEKFLVERVPVKTDRVPRDKPDTDGRYRLFPILNGFPEEPKLGPETEGDNKKYYIPDKNRINLTSWEQ